MWGFASQAGAGMAIATLTATYYALVRRNYQLEREAAVAVDGHGDAPPANNEFGRNRGDNSHKLTTSQQLLLKKELQELSLLNGSASGINILYQPHRHPFYRVPRSNFEINRIISRVNTRPSTTFSEEELETEGNGDLATSASLFGSDPSIESNQTSVIMSGESESVAISDQEQISELSTSEAGEISSFVESSVSEEPGEILENEEDQSELDVGDLDLGSRTVVEKWRSIQDRMELNRTKSPICFYKNPGFGNRYAFKMREHPTKPKTLVVEPPEPPPATEGASIEKGKDSAKEIKTIEKRQSDKVSNVQMGSTKSLINSTQFLMSPVLSESNTSICEKETPVKLRKSCRVTFADEADVIPRDSTKPLDSTLKDISAYNDKLMKTTCAHKGKGDEENGPAIQVRADPEVCNLCPNPLETRKTPLVLDEETNDMKNTMYDDDKANETEGYSEKSKEIFYDKSQPQSKLIMESDTNNNNPEKMKEVLSPEDTETKSSSNGAPNKEENVVTLLTQESSLVTGIPEDSWISLPIRVYSNSMSTMPWNTIGVCILVVVVAGFLGAFLSRIANAIVLPEGHRRF